MPWTSHVIFSPSTFHELQKANVDNTVSSHIKTSGRTVLGCSISRLYVQFERAIALLPNMFAGLHPEASCLKEILPSDLPRIGLRMIKTIVMIHEVFLRRRED